MSKLLEFFNDMRDNGYGLAEIAAQLGTSAIAEPVAGFAAMYDPANGADAIREGMTYQPRSEAAKMYQQGASNVVGQAIKPVMPVIDAWQKGVDIAGRYSPVVGAGLRTVPTAIGIAMGAKPALQAGRQVSEGLGAMQGRMVQNATAPNTLNTGRFMGQRGTFAGISALTADKEALAKAQQMIAQGVDPEDVWKETGWGRGADGKWRFEISDDAAKLVNVPVNKSWEQFAKAAETEKYGRRGANVSSMSAKEFKDFKKWRAGLEDEYNKTNATMRPLSEIFQHEQAASAYPDVYNSLSAHWDASMGKNGSFGNGKIAFGDVSNQEGVKGLFGHELQHAIQQREGFARGGNPEQFKGIVKDPYEWYRRLAGEVEARMTQNRMNLDAQQRRDIYPFAVGRYGYEDIPKDKQIINFDNNKAMSQKPLTEFEQAHLTAQRNAALPVEKGGLGLPADNTAMDRARAMGFDVDNPVYHGTDKAFDEFKNTPNFFSENKNIAEQFGKSKEYLLKKGDNQFLINQGNLTREQRDYFNNLEGRLFDEDDLDSFSSDYEGLSDSMEWGNTYKDAGKSAQYAVINAIKKDKYTHLVMPDFHNDGGDMVSVSFDPKNIRSRFAAFDPMKRDSANLLAQYGAIAPTTALGAYMYNEKRKKSQGNQ